MDFFLLCNPSLAKNYGKKHWGTEKLKRAQFYQTLGPQKALCC